MSNNQESVILIVGLCSQQGRSSSPYRRYMLDTACAFGPVWLFDRPGQSWQDEHIAGKTEFDVFDVDEAVERACALAIKVGIGAVWGPDEATVPVAAAIAERLGLPGLGEQATRLARDKGKSRDAFRRAGLRQPQSLPVASISDAVTLADSVGLPVVLKPRHLGSSLGVSVAQDRNEVVRAYAAASKASYAGLESTTGQVLLEEFIDGEEVSVDGVLIDGTYHPVLIARKELGFEPFFEEVAHRVFPSDPLYSDESFLRVLSSGHQALGLTTGATHTEVKLSSKGAIIVEVNARPGGDFIPLAGSLAGGLDPIRANLMAVLGNFEELKELLPRKATRFAGVKFHYPPSDVRVLRLKPNSSEQETSASRQTLPLVEEQAVLKLPPLGYVSRYAYTLAVADTEADLNRHLALGETDMDVLFEDL